MKISSIKGRLVDFWKAKKVWRTPKKAKVLIYDRSGSKLFLEYICADSVEILDTRGESINIAVLLKSLANGLSNYSYLSTYIKMVDPGIALTFIDNNPDFYKLKKLKPNLETVFVQNGLRSVVGDVFGHLSNVPVADKKNYHVDHMLCFGEAIGNKYGEYIAGNVVAIGSFKNNNVRKPQGFVNEGTVLFLSQYRKPKIDGSPMLYNDGLPIYWDDFFASEAFFLPLLYKYCQEKSLRLQICGCANEGQFLEKEFFMNILGDSNWEYVPRKSEHSSYELVDQSPFVVMIDTTLGYESLGRGKKVAAFTTRGRSIQSEARNFGWPAELNDNGPFWTNNFDETEFRRVMDYVTTATDDEWDINKKKYIRGLMVFDRGNTKFIDLMKDLQVPLNFLNNA